ncbi:MAG: response regulator transcription factor [Nitrospira sp.]|nr:response regulator transcription factor [Nitrospira sp.]
MTVIARRSGKFAVTVIMFALCWVSGMGLDPTGGHAAVVGALDFSRGAMGVNGNGIEAPSGAALLTVTGQSLPLPMMPLFAGIGRLGASLNSLLTIPVASGDPGDGVSEESGSIFGSVFLDLSWERTVALMQPFVMMAGDRGGAARKTTTEQVPIPAAVVLFGSGLCGIVGIVVRRQGPVRRQDFESGVSTCPSQVTRSCEVFLLSSDRTFSSDLEEQLQRAGYQYRAATSVAELLEWARHRPPALVLVDRRVADWDMLRTEQAIAHVPILTLISREVMENDEDIAADLERGADGVYSCRDGHKLFLAMIGSYCRRAGHDMARRGVYQIGDVQLDADTHELTIGSETVHLSAKQFAILQVFMSAPSKVFAREELIGLVWGPGFAIGAHTLDVHIHALRKLLGRDTDHGCEIVAIKGVGFKLKVRHSSESTGRAIESLSRMAFAKSVQRGELLDLLKGQRRRAEAPVKAEATFLKRASRRNRFRALSRNNRRPSATQCRAW